MLTIGWEMTIGLLLKEYYHLLLVVCILTVLVPRCQIESKILLNNENEHDLISVWESKVVT